MLRNYRKVRMGRWIYLRTDACAVCGEPVPVWATSNHVIYYHNGYLWMQPNALIKNCFTTNKAEDCELGMENKALGP